MVTGVKVAPQPPEDEHLGLHLMAVAPPWTTQSSPGVVVDVDGGITLDTDELSDRMREPNADSPAISPPPAESPFVASPDRETVFDSHASERAPRKVMIGELPPAPVAWGSLEEDESPSPTRKGASGHTSSKKMSKDKHVKDKPEEGMVSCMN